MSLLDNTLEREIDLLSRFIALLNEEQGALKAATPEVLPKIHEGKALLVDTLNTLETERIKLIGGATSVPDRERMIAWLANHPSEKKVATHWQALIKLAQEAKQLNELNASLVRLHLEKTTRALAILTRHAQDNVLYGSNGQAAQYTGSRIVDSA